MNRPSTTAMADKNFLLVGIFFKNRNLSKKISIKTIITPNSTFLVCVGSISGKFGQAMVHILAQNAGS